MSGTLGPIPQPFQVDVLPSGFSDLKDRWNVALGICTMSIAFLTMIFTFSIPVVLWRYDKRQQQRQDQLLKEQHLQQQQLAAQQRLQGHVSQLSGAGGTAMGVISSFKDDCESLGLSYAEVFRRRELIPGQAAAATRQQLHEVDQARRRLQGIWDNIMDDYRAGLLGGSIRDRQHGRMLRRGLAYMKLVEPLEAANFTRMQELYAVAPEGPYVQPGHAPQSNSLEGVAIMSRPGARPSRFRWLENEQTIKLIKIPLWPSGAEQQITEYYISTAAAKELEGGSAEQQVWAKDLKKHWAALQQACTTSRAPTAAAAPAAGVAPAAAVAGQQLQVVVATPPT